MHEPKLRIAIRGPVISVDKGACIDADTSTNSKSIGTHDAKRRCSEHAGRTVVTGADHIVRSFDIVHFPKSKASTLTAIFTGHAHRHRYGTRHGTAEWIAEWMTVQVANPLVSKQAQIRRLGRRDSSEITSPPRPWRPSNSVLAATNPPAVTIRKAVLARSCY